MRMTSLSRGCEQRMSKITHLLLTLTRAVSASTSLLSVTVTQPSTGTSGAAIHVAVSGLPLAGLTTSPATLVPAFAPATHDYAVRCGPGRPDRDRHREPGREPGGDRRDPGRTVLDPLPAARLPTDAGEQAGDAS